MEAVMVAFKVQAEEATFVPGYKGIPWHVIWYVKMDFTCTFSSVVSWELVQIAMMVAGLNRLDIRLVDIGNTYLTAPSTEK
jgi:hypothetical protein